MIPGGYRHPFPFPILGLMMLCALGGSCSGKPSREDDGAARPPDVMTGKTEQTSAPAPQAGGRVIKSDEEWKRILTPEQYQTCRLKVTEPSFSGKYLNTFEPGIYVCPGCGSELFSSDAKYKSGGGWPAFRAPIRPDVVRYLDDWTLSMHRIEVQCSRCEAHLGHVFDDGPPPTGKRYCINSASINFLPRK